jgi:hypothetical protein
MIITQGCMRLWDDADYTFLLLSILLHSYVHRMNILAITELTAVSTLSYFRQKVKKKKNNAKNSKCYIKKIEKFDDF